ncbi:MAG: hypothetical protein CMK50_02585 [Propionibacteriaceae bacterium]|nr:hypothetical protein [Propionibacteriaceae bacterium]
MDCLTRTFWFTQFHRDPKSWASDQRVWVDHLQPGSNGQAFLLKPSRDMRDENTVTLRFNLKRWKFKEIGWTVNYR